MPLADLKFADYPRRELRAGLQASVRDHGSAMPEYALDEIVDLACHAAAASRRAMLEVLDRASDSRMTPTAVGLAISLIASDCEAFEGALRHYAKSTGAVFEAKSVKIGGAAHG